MSFDVLKVGGQDFLAAFDELNEQGKKLEASEILFNAMQAHPAELCQLLREQRKLLRFWSKFPGNPELDSHEDPEDWAYLLTGPEDVRIALETFSMRTYSRPVNRYFLAMDEDPEHEPLRELFMQAINSVDQGQVVRWANEAVEEAWDIQIQDGAKWSKDAQTNAFELDVKDFSREATLRFCGRYYGLPREQVVNGAFRRISGEAFDQFIWKLFSRHFASPPTSPDPMPALGELSYHALQAVDVQNPVTFTDYLVGLNYKKRVGSDGELGITNRALISNLIGGFQGFIDNAVSCCTLIVNALIKGIEINGKTLTFQDLQNADEKRIRELIRAILVKCPPAPWLPRVGNVASLPGWQNTAVSNFHECSDVDAPLDASSCVLSMLSAMSVSEAECPYPHSPRSPEVLADDFRYDQPHDLSLGYGYHRCPGLDLSDSLLVVMLKRIATLNKPKIRHPLERKWGWIVQNFSISASASPSSVETQWDLLKAEDHPVSLCVIPVTSEEGTSAEIRSANASLLKQIKPSSIEALSDNEFVCFSDQQLSALTDSQLKVVSTSQIKSLGKRINVLSTEQLVILSAQTLGGLAGQQPSVVSLLDDDKVIGMVRTLDLASVGYFALEIVQRARQIAINKITRMSSRRPHAHSLWSTSYFTEISGDYTSWPGLVDYAWTARHLPQIESNLPELGVFQSPEEPGSLTSLFKVQAGKQREKSEHTSLLFTWFAQWVSDSFLRTDIPDRRRNESNHQVDLCQLYGLNEDTARMLREHSGGRLLSEDINGEEYLPKLFDGNGQVKDRFRKLPYVQNGKIRQQLAEFPDALERSNSLFAVALDRGNSSFGYVAITTLFLREHNRVCAGLEERNPDWDDERLFQTARMILTVILLKLVIEEYINHIAEPARSDGGGRYSFDNTFAEDEPWYRPPRITLEFNLLYRWHSMVPSQYDIGGRSYSFSEFRLNNEPLLKNGLGALLDQGSKQAAGKPGLFNTDANLLAAEFAALKMSRDYKVASFNDYRERFGLSPIRTFSELTEDKEVIKQLKERYSNINEVEFLVGLYAEDPNLASGMFGHLMTTMLGFDAFTQTLTNPLLSENIFTADTFTQWGLEEIARTGTLSDMWDRNGGAKNPNVTVSMKFKSSDAGIGIA